MSESERLVRSQAVSRNYEAFRRLLPELLMAHAGKFALMRGGDITEFFDTAADAFRAEESSTQISDSRYSKLSTELLIWDSFRMPCLSGQFNPAVGILISVGVFPPGSATTAAIGSGPVTPFFGLVDSGASNTCISPNIAQALGLQPVGLHPMHSAHQTAPTNVYQIDLAILFGNQAFVLANSQVMEFAVPANSHFNFSSEEM